MAYIDKQGFWVLKVMIEGQSYTERTELRGESQKVEREAKCRQDDFKRRKKEEHARGQASMMKGEDGDILDHGLATAFEKYFVQQGQYAKGHASKDIDRDLTWVAANLGPTTLLTDLTNRKLVELREKRRVMPKYDKEGYAQISGRTCNATFERLKFCLNWLKETGYTVPEIAWKRVWVEEDPRETRFTVETARLLVRTMRRDYLDCLIFALLGGPRRRQFVSLKWSDINWDEGNIVLIRQKRRGAKKKRAKTQTRIPITPWMRELIKRQIDPETGEPYHPSYVWTFVAERTTINRKAGDGFYEEGERYPMTYSGLGSAWHRWKKTNGVTNCRLHDLRHAAGTLLEDTANDLGLAQQMLGHSNRATTEGYVHQSMDRLAAAMAATHEALRAKLEGREVDLRGGDEDEADDAFGDEAEEAVAG